MKRFRAFWRGAGAAALLAGLAGGCSMQDFGGSGDALTEVVDGVSSAQSAQESELRSDKLAQLLVTWRQQNGAAEEDYLIGPGDVLEINIFALEHPGQPSLLPRSVSAEGAVNLPFIGDLNLTGLTSRQAIKAISDAYEGSYLRKPQVAVSITEYRSAPVVVTGAVKLPGIYYLRRQSSTVLEMLSLANGLAPEAGNELLIVRGETPGSQPDSTNAVDLSTPSETPSEPPVAPEVTSAAEPEGLSEMTVLEPTQTDSTAKPKRKSGSKRRGAKKNDDQAAAPAPEPATVVADEAGDENADEFLPDSEGSLVSVDLRRLLVSGDIRHNVSVRGGDVITVPPLKKEFVYVLGYVQRPGAVELRIDQQMQALQAVAMAGGLSSSARAQNSTLITETDGRRKTVSVDLTSMKRGKSPPAFLKPGDILIVGSSSLAKMAEFLKLSAGANYSPVP